MDEIQKPMYGTQRGDVFSFGIIVQEIMLKDLPYSHACELDPQGEYM